MNLPLPVAAHHCKVGEIMAVLEGLKALERGVHRSCYPARLETVAWKLF